MWHGWELECKLRCVLENAQVRILNDLNMSAHAFIKCLHQLS